MKVRAEVGKRTRPAAEFLRDRPRLQAAQADARRGDRPAHRLDQVDQGEAVAPLRTPGGDLDTGEDDLAVTRLGQGDGLLPRRLRRFGAQRAAGVGDDAVGAEVAAAVLHLQHRPCPPLQPAGGEDLKGAAAKGVVHRHARLAPADQ